jgi:Na+-driven multidrug efflux pump
MVFGRGKGHAQFGWFRDSEIGPVLRLALPVILSNGLQSLLQVVDAAFLGHLGPTELAASALGNAYFNMVRTWA